MTAYPLTGKPWAFATLIEDSAAEAAEAARRGAQPPPDVAHALATLARKAAAYDEEFGYDGDARREETARADATLRAALDRLVAVRVSASEAARMTGRARTAIVHLIQDGTLYAEREGRDWRIPVYALDALPPKGPAGRKPKAQAAASQSSRGRRSKA